MTSNSHHLPSLPDINDVHAFSPGDYACMEEIREVLLRRGCLQRFGLMLLHRHFPLSDDEILVESVDVQKSSHYAGTKENLTRWDRDRDSVAI